MRLFGIEIGVGLNSTGFTQGLDNVKRQLSSFGSGWIPRLIGPAALAGLGAFIVSSFKNALDRVKEIKIGAIKMGVGKEDFQVIDNALKASDVSAEQLDRSLVKLSEEMVNVKGTGEEAKKARDAFAVFGITIDDVEKKGRHRIFNQMSEDLRAAAKAGELTEQQLSALKHLLGRGAIELLPFMTRGPQASDLGGVFNEDELKRLEKAKEAVTELKAVFRDIQNNAAMMFLKVSQLTPGNLIGSWLVAKYFKGTTSPEQSKQIEDMLAKLSVADREKARRMAEAKNLEDETQARREHIAELDFAEQANKDKLLTKEEKLAKLAEKRAELIATIAKLDQFVGPQKPLEKEEKRAEIREKISELEVESSQLDKGSRLRQPHSITALQQIGAQINGPLVESDAQRRTAQNTENINRVAAAILEAMKRSPNNDIRRNDPFA